MGWPRGRVEPRGREEKREGWSENGVIITLVLFLCL